MDWYYKPAYNMYIIVHFQREERNFLHLIMIFIKADNGLVLQACIKEEVAHKSAALSLNSQPSMSHSKSKSLGMRHLASDGQRSYS